MIRIGIVTLPGSTEHRAVARILARIGVEPVSLWYADPDLDGVNALVLPGGPAPGAPPGHDPAGPHPLAVTLTGAADAGLPVLGIGAGFGALCAMGLLPGALEDNASGAFACRDQRLRVETGDTVWTCTFSEGHEVTLPVRTGQGRYLADADTLARLEEDHQVVLRHVDEEPTGSVNGIAGLTNAHGNVVGMLPDPVVALDARTGPSEDGRLFLESFLGFMALSR